MKYLLFFLVGIFGVLNSSLATTYKLYYSHEAMQNEARFNYALEKLSKAAGITALEPYKTGKALNQTSIYFGLVNSVSNTSKLLDQADLAQMNTAESFLILKKKKDSPLYILAKDESGLLYAVQTILRDNLLQVDAAIHVREAPEMVLRGTSIGLQKTAYLPGRDVYEYPYTEESFPWFYDKNHWMDYLDMMEENRYNTLYLWNGHPFSSLVKLKDYPYALEVDEATFVKNEEVYKFLTEEANKRGIWVIQMFYNILLPKPFADKHQLKTQERNRVITPLIEDYTRKSIAAFVAKYPNVGLLITLGEAMEGVGQDDINWFTNTIIPGVQDGLKAIDSKHEPPIILRAHDTDAPAVMKAALPIYKNLYTMAKYNGEALTTYTPRGKWAELHRSLSSIGTVHVQNVHILANLEPFRYGSPDFIQKSIKAMHDVYHSKGLHIYPQASYWDWPYSADKATNRMLQLDRDWMWYKAWARYSWKAEYPKEEEQQYWAESLANHYGITEKNATNLLLAIEEIGEISPKILRRFGITDGNRQTSSLGMLMTQLINPYRYGLFTLLYESEAPEGEMIIDYAEKDFKGLPHHGETPMQVAEEIMEHANKAVNAISSVGKPTKNKLDFERLLNDIHIHQALAQHYSHKVKAAITLLGYKYKKDPLILAQAIPDFESSVEAYRTLTNLTQDTYLYANSMQTKQRKIPMRGVDATFKHWKEMLPVFEQELANFKKSLDSLKQNTATTNVAQKKYTAATVKFSAPVEYAEMKKGSKLYVDQELVITHLPKELEGLNGIRTNSEEQKLNGTHLVFENEKPVKFLVGYFNSDDKVFAPKPILEIDASANNHGQAEAKIRNAVRLQYMPILDVHTYSFAKGKNELKIPKGEALILGIIIDEELLTPYNADIDNQGDDLDDLFGYYMDTKL